MKKTAPSLLVFLLFISSLAAQTHYDVTAGNGNGFRFWNGSNSYKIHMGNSSEYKYGGVNDYSIKMNMNSDPDRGWVWGVSGQTPIASLNTLGDFHFEGELYANHGWLRVKGNRGILFQDYGGGFFMQDNTWIRTYGSKNFYHNSGIMRTDGRFEVGPGGNKFTVGTNGRVGVGITNPAQEIDVNGEVQSKGFVLVDATYGSNSDYTAIFRDDIATDNATVKLRIGDDTVGSFHIGYKYWSTGEWITRFYVHNNGKVGIGTTSPDAKLTVKGDIHAEEVKVDLSVPGPDYVFKEDYPLKSLEEVQTYIRQHGHLPNIPSAKTMEEEGIDLGEMNMKLLEKIEELTLYSLEQEHQLKLHSAKIKLLEQQNARIAIIEEKIKSLAPNK